MLGVGDPDSEGTEPEGVRVWAAWVALGVDAQQLGGGIAVLGGVTLAVLSTLRYIKRTEDDVVDNLRTEIIRLQAQVAEARAEVETVRVEARTEVATLRRDNARLHKQLEVLVTLIRESGVPIPADFWATPGA